MAPLQLHHAIAEMMPFQLPALLCL